MVCNHVTACNTDAGRYYRIPSSTPSRFVCQALMADRSFRVLYAYAMLQALTTLKDHLTLAYECNTC